LYQEDEGVDLLLEVLERGEGAALQELALEVANMHSIWFNQEACFGVKCLVQRGCSSNQSSTLSVSCIERLSQTIWPRPVG
jgi:hypothetical protein